MSYAFSITILFESYLTSDKIPFYIIPDLLHIISEELLKRNVLLPNLALFYTDLYCHHSLLYFLNYPYFLSNKGYIICSKIRHMNKDDVKVGKDILHGKNKKLMNEIINEVMKKEKIGISQKELSELVDMHRDSLRRYMNALIDHGLIKRNSKKGKYYINPIYFGKSDIGGIAFGSHFLSEILGKDNISPDNKNNDWNRLLLKESTRKSLWNNVWLQKRIYQKKF